MSDVPSLSLWSSIKIPTCTYSKRNVIENESSVPHSDSRGKPEKLNHVPEAKPKREMVNLKVPSPPPAKENKNSFSGLVCEQSEVHEKTRKRKQSKKVKIFKLPDIPLLSDKLDEAVKITNCESSLKSISYYGDVLEESEERYEWRFEKSISDEEEEEESKEKWEEENKDIPLIKPWTLQELEKISERYNVTENKFKKVYKTYKTSKQKDKFGDSKHSSNGASDKKPKSPHWQSRDTNFKGSEFYFNCEWTKAESDSSPDDLLHLYESVADPGKLKSEGEKYYKSKLAQLRLIERGIKS